MEGKKAWTQLEKAVYPHLDKLLKANTLAIDPSSGSYSSQPGYALYKEGVLEDSGIVNIHSGDHVANRLYRLRNILQTEFETPDILVIENIPPFMAEKGGSQFATRNVISLHQSIGVVMSIWDVPVITVSPKSWRFLTPDGYKKDDEHDAIMIGWAAIEKARSLAGSESVSLSKDLLHKLTTGQWPDEVKDGN